MPEIHEVSINGNVTQRLTLDYEAHTVEKWEFVADVWTKTVDRAMTDDEITDRNADYSERTIVSRVTAALLSNKAFLDLAAPSTAQAVAQLKSLTRQVNALLRQQIKDLGV